MTTKRAWPAIDGSKSKDDPERTVEIPVGRHEVEIAEDSFGFGKKWIVLKNTTIGGPEAYWKQWINDGTFVGKKSHPDFGTRIDWGDLEIVIEK